METEFDFTCRCCWARWNGMDRWYFIPHAPTCPEYDPEKEKLYSESDY